MAHFVNCYGFVNPRGFYCAECHQIRERESLEVALLREREKIPRLEIIYGTYWRHYAAPHEFEMTLLVEREDCPYCGEPLGPLYVRSEDGSILERRLTIDHMDPLERGGEDSIRNTVFSCKRCNSRKRAKPFIDWLALLPPSLAEAARQIYARKHGHAPEAFEEGSPSVRSDGASSDLCLEEAALKQKYPAPIVTGPPSNQPIVVTDEVTPEMVASALERARNGRLTWVLSARGGRAHVAYEGDEVAACGLDLATTKGTRPLILAKAPEDVATRCKRCIRSIAARHLWERFKEEPGP